MLVDNSNEFDISIRETQARGFDKRSRATTLRMRLRTEEILTVCAAAEQDDVVEFIVTLLNKFVETNPVKNRMYKLEALAAASNTTVEEYIQAVLERRFGQIEYDFDSVSALDRVLLKSADK